MWADAPLNHIKIKIKLYIIFKIDTEEMRDVSPQMAHDMHGTLLQNKNLFMLV